MILRQSFSQAADLHCAHLQVSVHSAGPRAAPTGDRPAPASGGAAPRGTRAVRAALPERGGPVPVSPPRQGAAPQGRAEPALGPGVGSGPAQGQLAPDRSPQPGPAGLHGPRRAHQQPGPRTLEAFLRISLQTIAVSFSKHLWC